MKEGLVLTWGHNLYTAELDWRLDWGKPSLSPHPVHFIWTWLECYTARVWLWLWPWGGVWSISTSLNLTETISSIKIAYIISLLGCFQLGTSIMVKKTVISDIGFECLCFQWLLCFICNRKNSQETRGVSEWKDGAAQAREYSKRARALF